MLFSATVPKWVKKLVKQYLNDPVNIDLVSWRLLSLEVPGGGWVALLRQRLLHACLPAAAARCRLPACSPLARLLNLLCPLRPHTHRWATATRARCPTASPRWRSRCPRTRAARCWWTC